MHPTSHQSAKPSHYNREAKHYDAFNEENSKLTNQTIERILKKYRVKTVLDLTCGTGSQVLWLANRGYDVTGSDFNARMLNVARHKAKEEKLLLKFLRGDMRNIRVGTFDAVITIFNAVGHLTKLDFEVAMRNIYENLEKGGLYVFDIFNLSYFLKDDNITIFTIDWFTRSGQDQIRQIQYSTLDGEGVLTSYTTLHVQQGSKAPKITQRKQTLQIYSAKQLKAMLLRNGFRVVGLCGIDGSKFVESKTDRIIVIAKKR